MCNKSWAADCMGATWCRQIVDWVRLAKFWVTIKMWSRRKKWKRIRKQIKDNKTLLRKIENEQKKKVKAIKLKSNGGASINERSENEFYRSWEEPIKGKERELWKSKQKKENRKTVTNYIPLAIEKSKTRKQDLQKKGNLKKAKKNK